MEDVAVNYHENNYGINKLEHTCPSSINDEMAFVARFIFRKV